MGPVIYLYINITQHAHMGPVIYLYINITQHAHMGPVIYLYINITQHVRTYIYTYMYITAFVNNPHIPIARIRRYVQTQNIGEEAVMGSTITCVGLV